MPRKTGDHDARGAPKGRLGNVPHVRSEEAATLVRELSGYGMPQEEIVRVLNATFGGGYSVDTLSRHYRPEIDAAMASRKSDLLRRAHQIAMGDATVMVEGVSKDTALRESAAQLRWLLGAVHRVRDGAQIDFGAGTINVNITPDDADL